MIQCFYAYLTYFYIYLRNTSTLTSTNYNTSWIYKIFIVDYLTFTHHALSFWFLIIIRFELNSPEASVNPRPGPTRPIKELLTPSGLITISAMTSKAEKPREISKHIYTRTNIINVRVCSFVCYDFTR